jgi:hypothetical protein
MNEMIGSLSAAAPRPEQRSRPLEIFASWRLQAYGFTLAALYVAIFVYLYCLGLWLLNKYGAPVYSDFTNMFVAGWEALHGNATSAYDPVEHVKAQDALVGAGHASFSLWPYPPTYFLILAPLAMLPYVAAFLIWCLTTLLACTAVVYAIVRRRPAIALALASPFTVWNILAGQSGFLTAALLGATLVFLERRPIVAGVFIGCLTYKPQWGILLPIALIAAKEWRIMGSAVAMTALLVAASIAIFGIGPWEAFPRELLAQASINLSANPDLLNLRFDPRAKWQYYETIFGLARALHGSASLAWLAQGSVTIGSAVVIWLVWRSPTRYALKAATLSAAALVATPYAFGYDMAAIAIAVAFLTRDQIQFGLLRGEQTMLLGLFGASLLCNLEPLPLEPVVVITLMWFILRRLSIPCGSRSLSIGPEVVPERSWQ